MKITERVTMTIAALALAALPLEALAQGLPMPMQLPKPPLETQKAPAPGDNKATQALPCPKGRACVQVEAFTKADYKGEARKFQVGRFTQANGYSWLTFIQHIGDKHGVIVNTVKVRQGGKWVAYSQGVRLPEGRTEFNVPVPQGTQEVVVSFDHGRGAELKVVLERPLP